MPIPAATHQYHQTLATTIDSLHDVIDRRGFTILSGPCPSCLTTAWMSALHPIAFGGWSVWSIAPSSIRASFEYNGYMGMDIDAFMGHVIPTCLVINSLADGCEPDVDLEGTLALMERLIRARAELRLVTLWLTHQAEAVLPPVLVDLTSEYGAILKMPTHPDRACFIQLDGTGRNTGP